MYLLDVKFYYIIRVLIFKNVCMMLICRWVMMEEIERVTLNEGVFSKRAVHLFLSS